MRRRRMTTKRVAVGAAMAALTLGALAASAGPERVSFPEGFDTEFVHYSNVDRPDRKRVRELYINPEADAAAEPGEDLPHGTVIVMADRDARLDAEGDPVRDENGRFIPEGDFTGIFVMEKQEGWEESQTLDVISNGDWDYAAFRPDGTLNTDFGTEGCFSCHANRAGRDYTFTYYKQLLDQTE